MFESMGRVDDFGTNANECKDLILLAVRYAVRSIWHSHTHIMAPRHRKTL